LSRDGGQRSSFERRRESLSFPRARGARKPRRQQTKRFQPIYLSIMTRPSCQECSVEHVRTKSICCCRREPLFEILGGGTNWEHCRVPSTAASSVSLTQTTESEVSELAAFDLDGVRSETHCSHFTTASAPLNHGPL
jgi:hypothetical protein